MSEPQLHSDAELVTLTLKDQAFFAVLIERYESKLRRYIFRISSIHAEEIDDALQEVFINVYRNLNGFDQSLSFSSWIYRIAHNYVRSHFRKVKARPNTVKLEPAHYEELPSTFALDLELDKKIEKQKLIRALEQLDEKYKVPLVLKYLEEKEYTEIADILQKPVGTVGTLINRAKKKLKTILEKEGVLV